jgi:hypothetical protein
MLLSSTLTDPPSGEPTVGLLCARPREALSLPGLTGLAASQPAAQLPRSRHVQQAWSCSPQSDGLIAAVEQTLPECSYLQPTGGENRGTTPGVPPCSTEPGSLC